MSYCLLRHVYLETKICIVQQIGIYVYDFTYKHTCILTDAVMKDYTEIWIIILFLWRDHICICMYVTWPERTSQTCM